MGKAAKYYGSLAVDVAITYCDKDFTDVSGYGVLSCLLGRV